LKQTRQSLQAAIQANNTAEIQQLASAEGGEMGQLAAIRSSALAQVYQILTPDQQQKWAQLRQARNAARHSSGAAPQNN
jgi:Spy/CpxP family protein refolding chaperone